MKTAVITGASRGIGAAIAKRLSADGYNTIINYNNSQEKAAALADSLVNSYAVKADVKNEAEVAKLIAFTHERFGKIDLLVNNAGVAYTALLGDTSAADFDEIIGVNLKSAYLLSRAVLPDMINKKSGCIINISSMWGQTGASCEVIYSASKAGIIGFTKALAKETGPCGIRVNCISPGVIDTDMNNNLSSDDIAALSDETPLMRIGTPDDVANAVSFLASENAAFITGQIIGVNGGFII